jgi:putative phage-type endonuclease
MIRRNVVQGSAEWLETRRDLITATDIAPILGVSPYRCEADIAAIKTGRPTFESNIPMRVGTALEPLIASEYQGKTGRRLRRVRGLWVHPGIPWAAASPDYTVVGERRLVEAKWSGSKSRFADGLPEDIACQAQWQLFVSGYGACDIAALTPSELLIFTVEADPALQDSLLVVAEDFRRRLAAGGPFRQSLDSLKRTHPADDGTAIEADAETAEAVESLWNLRAQRRQLERAEEELEVRVKDRMGDAAVLSGPGWKVTWKRTKDREEVNWKALAEEEFLQRLPESERGKLVGKHTMVKEGFRPFRIVWERED